MKGLQQWSTRREGVRGTHRRDPHRQPLKAATIARVFHPWSGDDGRCDLVQGDLEHQIGPMGLGAHAEIGGERESQIELIDRLVDGTARWSAGRESSIASHSGTEDQEARRSDRAATAVEAVDRQRSATRDRRAAMV